MSEAKQILLNAKGCSGRGVRLRVLDPVTRSAVREQSAKQLGPEATMAEWTTRENVAGIIATVLEVTAKGGYAKMADLLAEAVEWKKVSVDELEDRLHEYFGVKDLDALAKAFRRLHDVTDKELDDILGEALDVTAG